ncbi:MAG TPA: Ig-like domain-containing protein [Isosphaeraceae bacterium]|jgi:hypothetical protein|nr:Ig-like domain-containing protein [Isosphaeraceae bacterium]
MDRRFVPSAEGLETRQLLSTAAKPLPDPITQFDTQLAHHDRTNHLAGFLYQIEPGRFVSQPIVNQIQNDYKALRATLHPADPVALNSFNVELRKLTQNASLTATDVFQLNRTFGRALGTANANPNIIVDLQGQMTQLAHVDSVSPNPLSLATNDYSLVLQDALSIGRPLPPPKVPHLNVADHAIPGNKVLTYNTEPRIVGTYTANTAIYLIENGGIVGQAITPSTGTFSVTPINALGYGTHTFTVVGQNIAGDVSLPSPSLTITVIPKPVTPSKHPKGPAAKA